MRRFAVMCLLLCATFALRAAEFKTDDEGFIRNWLLLVPIPITEGSAADDLDKQQIKDEATIKPKEGEKVKIGDKEYTWKAVQTKDYFFDINELLGNTTENALCYAVAYIHADDDVKNVKLQMGSNDEGKAYLNGKEIVKFTETRTLEKDQNAAETNLVKGVNVLVFKVINESNNFQGCIRFTDKGGAPVKNVKITLAP